MAVVGTKVVVIAVVVVGAEVVGVDVVPCALVVGGSQACAWAVPIIDLMTGFVQMLGRPRAVATPPITTLRTCRRSRRFNSICETPSMNTLSMANAPIPPMLALHQSTDV